MDESPAWTICSSRTWVNPAKLLAMLLLPTSKQAEPLELQRKELQGETTAW
jgi:hypothetical protein